MLSLDIKEYSFKKFPFESIVKIIQEFDPKTQDYFKRLEDNNISISNHAYRNYFWNHSIMADMRNIHYFYEFFKRRESDNHGRPTQQHINKIKAAIESSKELEKFVNIEAKIQLEHSRANLEQFIERYNSYKDDNFYRDNFWNLELISNKLPTKSDVLKIGTAILKETAKNLNIKKYSSIASQLIYCIHPTSSPIKEKPIGKYYGIILNGIELMYPRYYDNFEKTPDNSLCIQISSPDFDPVSTSIPIQTHKNIETPTKREYKLEIQTETIHADYWWVYRQEQDSYINS